ncbi:MAG: C10 family peptidase [Prevotella sp.]|nr:C10 family peptidase [Prevotella sp.]
MTKLKNTLLVLALATTPLLHANPIDKAEARIIAQEFVGINDVSTDAVPQAPYYVFSRGEGRGYVIVSGDDATTPIIGYTDQGDFDYNALPDPLRIMLDTWTTKIEKLQQSQNETESGLRPAARRNARARLEAARKGMDSFKSSWKDVAPLILTHWNQGYPYNIFAPCRSDNGQKTLSGCEATAAAQVVYYFRRDNPSELLYSTPTYNESWFNAPVTYSLPKGTPVRYDLMRLSGSGSAAQDTAVAVLMYALGTCAHLGYGYQDGTATAGNTDKMGEAMDNQFNLSNNYCEKWNYTQMGWESMVYSNLSSGRPMLYSGANDDGGHAVVLDGYQASTGLYHFNFGWGGSGDGWYTVDDETGMNGYSSGQALLSQITPKKANLKGELVRMSSLYMKVDNKIKATVYNNGTLACNSVKLYCGTSSNMLNNYEQDPLASVSIPSGKSAEIEWIYSPIRQTNIYVFLCDAKNNLLDSMKLAVVPTIADLHLNSLKAETNSETETFNDMAFQVVNNTSVNILADFQNREEGSFCQPTMQCKLSVYDTEAKKWSPSGSKTLTDVVFEVGERKTVSFVFDNLTPGNYYKAEMNKSVRAGRASEITYESNDTIALFKVLAPDLEVTFEGRKAIVTGSWNNDVFNQKKGGAEVCVYDFTATKALNTQPIADNPNALFVVAAPIPGTKNTIAEGVCDNLVLTSEADFMPMETFSARKATFVVERAKVGEWVDVVIPFAATAPRGMLLRQLKDLEGTALVVDQQRNAEPMSIALCMIDHLGNNVFTSNDVSIGVQTETSIADGQLVGSTMASEVGKDMMAFTIYNNLPYYRPTDEGSPLPPFATLMTITKRSGVRAFDTRYGNDRYYMELAQTINEAYTVVAENPSGEGVELLMEALTKAEETFSFATEESVENVKTEKNDLQKAIEDFKNGAASGIMSMWTDNSQNLSAPIEYFNMNGQRLQSPERGIVIVKQGNRIRKVKVR